MCTKCIAEFHLESDACFSACPAGFYSVPDSDTNFGGVCTACSGCNTCSNVSDCLSCTSGNQLDGTTCAATCPAGTYILPDPAATIGGVCTTCLVEHCYECASAAACTKCDEGKSLHNNECIDTCPVTYFSDEDADSLIGGICTACSTGCRVCSDENTCSECAQGYSLESDACVA
jgi:ferredoxin-like protein FixX